MYVEYSWSTPSSTAPGTSRPKRMAKRFNMCRRTHNAPNIVVVQLCKQTSSVKFEISISLVLTPLEDKRFIWKTHYSTSHYGMVWLSVCLSVRFVYPLTISRGYPVTGPCAGSGFDWQQREQRRSDQNGGRFWIHHHNDAADDDHPWDGVKRRRRVLIREDKNPYLPCMADFSMVQKCRRNSEVDRLMM